MACRDTDLLWKEYFRDPTQFWDNRHGKRSRKSPDFRHKQSRSPLWIDGCHNPPWVQDELRRSGLNDKAFLAWKMSGEDAELQDYAALFGLIKACANQKDLCKGRKIHADILEKGFLTKDISLGSALLNMYAKCGALVEAQEIFDELPARNVVTWTALIAGYAQHGLADEALSWFGRMQDEGPSPNAVTFSCILKACGSIGATEKGEEIHAEIRKQGLLRKDIVLGTALVDMYAKCGALANAQEVFDELPVRDLVTWNALIAGYAQHGLGDEALNSFARMREEGPSPDAVTFICILRACGCIGAAKQGEDIHAEVGRQGLLENNIVLGTALVDMYGKCGVVAKAQGVFDELAARVVVTWNALMDGYAQNGLGDEAMSCFGQMQDDGLLPDAVTFACILKVCGIIGAAEKGKEIHGEIDRQGLLGKNIMLGIALVDMYAKCGALVEAQEVFDELPTRDVVTWTALIAGYAQTGKCKLVFDSFRKMIGEGIEPNVVTFVVLLTACSHAGLLEEGQRYFDIMSTIYCIIPTLEHHTCMVDIFSRAGHLRRAISIVEMVPPSECLLLCSAVMGACRKWVHVELGRWAFEHVLHLDEKFTGAYVCMSNIYAAAGMKEEAYEVEALRIKNGAWKRPGRSWWTDAHKIVHSFTVGDKSHPQSKCIYATLEEIGQKLQLEGYAQGLQWVVQAISDDGMEDVLCSHSEKLGIACALINTPEGEPIRIRKNTGTCGDCHFAALLISKTKKRRIQVTDANRVHIFECGKCVCEDYRRC